MSTISPSRRQDILKWLLINAIIGISIPAFYKIEGYTSIEGLKTTWDDMLYGFMMSCGIILAVGFNEQILNRHYPWLEHAGKRLFFEIIGVSILGFSASFIMNVLFFTIFGLIDYSTFPWATLAENALIPLFIGYGITAFFISSGFLKRAKAEAIRAEKLQTEKYRSEVRMLRDQLNPHFLFNALNVLTNLVYEDADQSADYIRNLSRFYRYVLEVQNEDLVGLDRELKFTNDYIELQQERFGAEALLYSQELKDTKGFKVPPLALQLLVENALKHNRCSTKEPLKLSIVQEGKSLLIQNSLQKRSEQSDHLGIGLSNLRRRYEFLNADAPIITETDHTFKVKIPLIPA